MNVYVLNGPNLGRLGTRQVDIYGQTSYADLAELPATDTGPAPGHGAMQPARRSAGWWRAR